MTTFKQVSGPATSGNRDSAVSTSAAFIDLDRRFRELDPQRKPEDAALESYAAFCFGRETGLGWKELLERRLVVILGELGSGKTREFQECAKSVQGQGQFAFFIRLDALAADPLHILLPSEEWERFRQWQQSEDTATFFLDSVDEAKLQKPSDFLTALDHLRDAVGAGCLGRIRILVSSRISEWRPESDIAALRERFPVSSQQERIENKKIVKVPVERTQDVLVVQIQPLDRSRVEKFVCGKGIPNSESFIEALDSNHAWEFARRPLDVADLVSFWTTHRRLGLLTELIEHNLRCKLSETEDRAGRDPLSEQQRREGAETLAAAVVFSRRFNFKVPDDAHLAVDGALDASACLPEDWSSKQCRALLERAVFDGAAYGRIRFHSRRIAEYLAARWLAERKEAGCPVTTLDDLLFARAGELRVVRQSLAPVVAWLCCGDRSWNEDVRRWTLEAAPWIHLKYGDPSCLAHEYKRRIFQSLLAHYKGRERAWIDDDAETLGRLGEAALAGDVSTIIRNHEAAVDLRRAMFLLVRHARLVDCLDTALEIVAASDETDELKLYAILAIRDIGKPSHRQKLAQIVQEMPQVPSCLCAHICEALFPDAIDAAGLAELLRRTDEVRGHSSLPFYLKRHLDEKLPRDASGNLLLRLIELAETPPYFEYDGVPSPISARFHWLGEVISGLLTILLERPLLTAEETDTAARAMRMLALMKEQRDIYVKLPDDLNALTLKHPDVRRCCFWRRVAECRQKHGKEPVHMFLVFEHFEGLQTTAADFEWLLDDIGGRNAQEDRALALRFAVDLWIQSGRQRKGRRRIRQAASSDASLLRLFRERVALVRWFWLKRLWHERFRQHVANRWWWERRWREVKVTRNWLREEFILLWHLKRLNSGQRVDWLATLALEAAGGNQLSPQDWSGLEKKRGGFVAGAVKKGCKRAWRQHRPFLPHEKPETSTIYSVSIVGLVGLQAGITDGDLDISKLGEDEVRLAARYAVNEMNGFPWWFSDLAKHYPKPVGEVLGECIRGEWEFPAKREQAHEVLADLVWHGDALLHLVKDALLGLLQARDPANPTILHLALVLLTNNDNPPQAELAKLAEQRTRSYPTDSENFMPWLAMWMQLNAAAAIQFVQQVVASGTATAKLIERLCCALGGDRGRERPSIPNADFLRPIHLREFIPLVYEHVRPVDDINRTEDGAHFLTSRDNAQEFRESLLLRLANSDSPDAGAVLHDLAAEPVLAHLRDWILHLSEKRMEQDSDSRPWSPQDVRTFARHFETDPKTDADLFAIACRRLSDIKHDVEKGENSPREDLHEDDDELRLRRWFAGQLRSRSRSRYTVPQEEEIDRQQRPDLRLENPKTSPVSIEIKWADSESWSLRDLEEMLEKQLVGQYLRDAYSRYGIYLLGNIGRKAYWVDPRDGRRLDFVEVLLALQTRAKEIVMTHCNVAGIAVIGIDFTDPRHRSHPRMSSQKADL